MPGGGYTVGPSAFPHFVFFKWGRTSHLFNPLKFHRFSLAGRNNVQRGENNIRWGLRAERVGDDGGQRGEVHTDGTRPSCQSLLQQLLPLLLPQSLQVVCPLQGSLSEDRKMFIHAVDHLSPTVFSFLTDHGLWERRSSGLSPHAASGDCWQFLPSSRWLPSLWQITEKMTLNRGHFLSNKN